ncbi:MAG: hypothetical protein KGH89_07750 [Thaumarchaeota archaeon]|nr:hypothetical protein [Nitrososphaerota archaeon]
MKSIVLSSFLIMVLLLAAAMWTPAEGAEQNPCQQTAAHTGESLPSDTSLQVVVCSSYSYKATDGTTTVLGEIQNNNNSPITNVKIGITFEGLNNNVLEYKTGTTLLQVVEPNSIAPFSISSTKADPSITQVAVNLAGFTPASKKDQLLTVSPSSLQVSDNLILTGTIKNGGQSISTHTRLYLISYDAFQRTVAIGNTTVSDIGAGKTVDFTMTSEPSSREKTFQVIAESDNYQSVSIPVTNIVASLPVMISNTNVTNPSGSPYSSIPVYAPVKISSDLRYLLDSPQPYVYYVQVKKFGGQVDFIGNSTGIFLGGNDQEHTGSVSWTPDTAGSYFLETYVWDSNGVPISSAGTKINVVLVK